MGRIVGLVFKDTEIKDKEVRTNDIDLNKLTLEQLKSLAAVSYTHLDVYKRQEIGSF